MQQPSHIAYVTDIQDPIVFSGTVRYNLNPFGGGAADADLWAALQQAGLKETVYSLAVRHLSCQPCLRCLISDAAEAKSITHPQQCVTSQGVLD